MIDALPLLLGPEGYQISRSVRLRSAASAYFNRTPGSAGNRKTWTWSGWVKRSGFGVDDVNFLNAYASVANYAYFGFRFAATPGYETLEYYDSNNNFLTTTQVFRDPSAWYHIIIAFDTTQATAANRIKVYVNGTQITAFNRTAYPTQNTDSPLNQAIEHNLGRWPFTPVYFDGYLTEVNFIDGQALTPSSFGETNAVTGVWQPKRYTGTYGTNGFYLNFSDNSGATATTIGKDYSGNGNNWTPNNISVTAGVTYDSMLDVPTQWADGGNGRGNYATLNPLKKYTANFAFSDGNLAVSDAGSSVCMAAATMRTPTTGKWYWEITATTISGSLGYIAATSESVADASAGSGVASYRSNGAITNQAGTAQTSGASYTSGDVIGVAVDVGAGTVQFYKNNVAQGATPSFSFTAGTVIVPAVVADNAAGTKTFTANFGQRPFAYTPPTGFKALNTLNLPEPTILKGNQYFDAKTYTGTGATQTITVDFASDFAWLKRRDGAGENVLLDTLRLTGSLPNRLFSNSTAAESTAADGQNSFSSTGIVLDGTGGGGEVNTSGRTYVGWQWKANGTPAVTNTAGTITSTVSVGATQGFSVVTYTGNGVTGATVGHGLGVVPEFIIWKRRNAASNWISYNKTSGNGFSLYLDLTNANTASSYLNSTNPNSSVITMATNTDNNGNGGTYVAYCFASVAGFSKFGSYTGNGIADGPFVFTGFRPRFVMIKRTDSSNDWVILDTARNTFNVANSALFPNSSSSETSNGFYDSDIVSNGFKIRATNAVVNASGGTYIYAAFCESPFKNALAR